jgi:hypothetical protein
MDDPARAADFRARAQRIREQGRRLAARAAVMPEGVMRDMLEGQAAILAKGADDLEARAFALTPPLGTA